MKSKNGNFDAKLIDEDHVEIRASHPVAKQLFFGWGSDQNATDISFYGREDPTDKWSGNFDYKRWVWTLTAGGIDRMINNIEDHIDDTDYYKKGEVKKARELLGLLKKVEKGLV